MRDAVMTDTSAPPEGRAWRQARHSALVQDVLASLTQRPANLLGFREVQKKLQLGEPRYLGQQQVSLDQIAGSVSRETDFTRSFLPRQENLQERWQRIEQLRASGRDLPPVELYKVGQVYFVCDGNHRVSVARQHGTASLRAIVWEYETHVPLEPDCDVDDLLRAAAHAAFLEGTNLERAVPGAQIRLTQAESYDALLGEIQAYQQIFSTIDHREVSADEAIALWYDIRYMPVVEVVRQSQVHRRFPGRTETDLYLWLLRGRRELEASLGHHVSFEEATRTLTQQAAGGRLGPLGIPRALGRLLRGVACPGKILSSARQ